MAIFNLVINYPDGEQARILTALKAKYQTLDSLGNAVPITNAQAIEAFRQDVTQKIKDIVYAFEYKNAVDSAGVSVAPVNPA